MTIFIQSISIGKSRQKSVKSRSQLDLPPPSEPLPNPPNLAIDRGEAPDVVVFYGRVAELTKLAQWVDRDRCKLVAILGMGGIGKTALVTKLAQQLQPQFTMTVWRSLRNAPLLTNLLPELIQIFSQHMETIDPNLEISAQISRLLDYFARSRCLLVLDNAEAIIQSQHETDRDRHEYPGYDELLRRIGDAPHQSCLLLHQQGKTRSDRPPRGRTIGCADIRTARTDNSR